MRKAIVLIPLIVVVILAGSYVLLNLSVPPSQEGVEGPTSPSIGGSPYESANPIAEGISVKFKTASFIDSEGIGTKAFSMLIPSDWQAEGSIKWVLDNPAMPVAGEFRAWNSKGYEEFHLFPNQAFFWSNNPLNQQTFPLGSRYFGALVKTPMGPIDALKEIALPKFRGNAQDLKIISQQPLPQVAQYFQTGTDPATGVVTSVEGGKIRVEYILNGVLYEEELYCIIQSQDIPLQTIYGMTRNVNWYMTFTQSFRSERGKLDSQAKIFQTVAYFAKTEVNWLNKYNQVVEYLIQKQIQQIQSLGQLSSIISQTSNDISDANYAAWKQNQNVKDRLADEFSRSILGIEAYRNPIDSSIIDRPSGYSNAWVNNLGEYILSDSPSYNPNIGSTQSWYQMKKP